jgi:flagellar assembly factor FliW
VNHTLAIEVSMNTQMELEKEIQMVYPEVVTANPDTGEKIVNWKLLSSILWNENKKLKYQYADAVRDNKVKYARIRQLQNEIIHLK